MFKRLFGPRNAKPVLKMPKVFQVEVFAGCDLKCPLCHAGRKELDRDTKFLSLDNFKKIFDKIQPHAELLYLHIWGEPTLNKHLIGMIRYVSRNSPGCVTNVSTHGNGLSRDYIYELIESGLSQLIFSIDGISQETYEQYRIGGRFDEAYEALKSASEIKTQLGSSIAIFAQCIQMKQTIEDVEQYKLMMGLPGVLPLIKPLYIGGYGVDYEKFIADGCEIQSPTLSSCTALSDVLAIQADGQIIPCCLYPAPANGFDLGSIFDMSLEDLMLNRDRMRMRDSIESGIAPTEVCARSCGSKQGERSESSVKPVSFKK